MIGIPEEDLKFDPKSMAIKLLCHDIIRQLRQEIKKDKEKAND